MAKIVSEFPARPLTAQAQIEQIAGHIAAGYGWKAETIQKAAPYLPAANEARQVVIYIAKLLKHEKDDIARYFSVGIELVEAAIKNVGGEVVKGGALSKTIPAHVKRLSASLAKLPDSNPDPY
jgi:hypothetical protein